LIESPEGIRKIYQVVWDTSNSETMARENRALEAAKRELNIEGELVTPDTYLEQIWANF